MSPPTLLAILPVLLAETAAGLVSPEETQRRLESMRWVDRIGYHAWRALNHLAEVGNTAASEVYAEPEAQQARDWKSPG
jgi:hypothetical protein